MIPPSAHGPLPIASCPISPHPSVLSLPPPPPRAADAAGNPHLGEAPTKKGSCATQDAGGREGHNCTRCYSLGGTAPPTTKATRRRRPKRSGPRSSQPGWRSGSTNDRLNQIQQSKLMTNSTSMVPTSESLSTRVRRKIGDQMEKSQVHRPPIVSIIRPISEVDKKIVSSYASGTGYQLQ